MRSRRPSPEHQEAVARRLAQLGAELAAGPPPPASADEAWWDAHTRVAPGWEPEPLAPARSVAVDRPSPEPHEGLVVVPQPGRHAARRARPGPTALLPDELRGRVALGPPQVAVVAVLVALGLAITCWWVVRGRPEEGRLAAAPASGLLASASSAPADLVTPAGVTSIAGSSTADAAATVTVDVAGKVRRPGIVVLDAGSRVVDALDAAGGPRRGTDLTALNLARVLVDGEQVLVGRVPATGPATAVSPGAGVPAAPGALVNLNTADQTGLETLPGVGPVTAGSIIAWRTAHGGFTSVDELLEVDGIGDATLAQLAPLVTI